MITIHKFPIDRIAAGVDAGCLVMLPPGARILHVDLQEGILFLWALVDTEMVSTEEHRILVVGTGWNLDGKISSGSLHHLGTVLEHGGLYVWHCFERVNLEG